MALKDEKKNLDFERFAKMDYKELFQEAVGDLKTHKAKQAYKTMKTLTSYNANSKILNIKKGKKGPLLGKYNKEKAGETLTKEEDIGDEIKAFLKEHYYTNDRQDLMSGPRIVIRV